MKKVCIVLMDDQYYYIDSLRGVSFSEKIRSVVERDRTASTQESSRSTSKIGMYIDKYLQLSLFDVT